MKESASPAWRSIGERAAFEVLAWEFKSREFYGVARHLLEQFDKGIAEKRYETIMFLPTAQFMLSLALELIAKAHYLQSKAGPKEQVFSHDLWERLAEGVITDDQKTLMAHAQEYVEWAGRYPTPKWTTEKQKERFDAEKVVVDGVEGIHGPSIPNAASRGRCEEYIALYRHLLQSLKALPGSEPGVAADGGREPGSS